MRLEARPQAVRAALAELRGRWADDGLDRALSEAAEQVLAEVLNNVVEHAQAGRPGGVIVMSAEAGPDGIDCEVRDDGAPMPGRTAPEGVFPEIGALEELPEGGFGWALIRAMTEELRYCREGQWNCLRFRVPVGGARAWV